MSQSQGVANSRLKNFRNAAPKNRNEIIAAATELEKCDLSALRGEGVLPIEIADGMIENVIGKFELPMGIATNFTVNGRDYLIPMVVEEPSVVAAASYMARIARDNGGFRAESSEPIMRAQIQIIGLANLEVAKSQIVKEKQTIIDEANAYDSVLVDLGGGCRDIEIHKFSDTSIGSMLIVHLLVDVRDAMGANAVNTMAEGIAPMLEKITGGEVRLRILSNLADRRTVKARVSINPETLCTSDFDGNRIARGIIEAFALAEVDPYRAATHNKGIMNGIDPVVIATGNDWRAIEAGAHAWAARSGRYTSLSKWEVDSQGNLMGTLELPMALGLVGGATKTHPAAQACLRLMNVKTANELGEVVAAVGLAQNMAALRALATEGIQKGHMALHARNLAIAAGATGELVDDIAKKMVASNTITADKAKALMIERG